MRRTARTWKQLQTHLLGDRQGSTTVQGAAANGTRALDASWPARVISFTVSQEHPPNGRGASQLFAPRLRYQRCPPTPTRRALLLRGALRWMQGARRKRLHHAQRETGSLPTRAASRCGAEWPTAVEGALRHSESTGSLCPNRGATG
jgi:hypothetical protein